MRREWLIVAAVLVPFAVLVAAWVWRAPDEPRAVERPVEPIAVTARPAIRAEAAVLVDAAVREALLEPPPAIAAPINAVAREVQACFVDNGAHLHGRIEVSIAFEPTVDGGFRGVSVQTALPSPELTACLEDLFAEMHFEPTGRETFEPTRYTFIFDAPPR